MAADNLIVSLNDESGGIIKSATVNIWLMIEMANAWWDCGYARYSLWHIDNRVQSLLYLSGLADAATR